MQESAEYFLTEPTERILVRRGDPLGLRAAADGFADILAPGLTNRTYDARWLTILSWVLVAVDVARRKLGLPTPGTRLARQRAIYEWIQPLELMWIERAVRTFPDTKLLNGRQVPGRNALLDFVADNEKGPAFGMSREQRARFRFTGAHGAYRGLLGRLTGMTVEGDGYRPDKVAHQLANLLVPQVPLIHHPPNRKGRKPQPDAYWAEAWKGRHTRLQAGKKWLPGKRDTRPKLSAAEQRILGGALFDGIGSPARRLSVATAAARSGAMEHAEMCGDVVDALRSKLGRGELERLAPLVPFTKLADSGVDAMVAIWQAVKGATDGPTVPFAAIARDPQVRDSLSQLAKDAEAWRKAAAPFNAMSLLPAHSLASAASRGSFQARAEALVRHHIVTGSGRRWFRSHSSEVAIDTQTGGEGAAYYRFRLWSLGRLAWQTGQTAQMPGAFEDQGERGDDELEETDI